MIVSDHGMASGTPQSGAEYVEIDDYLDMDDVSYVIDRAAIAAVAPLPGKADKVNIFANTTPFHVVLVPALRLFALNNLSFNASKYPLILTTPSWRLCAYFQVYKQLKQMRGMDVYRRDDIPDHYHYKNGRYVQEILVCAKHGKHINNYNIFWQSGIPI